jgi:hypothetical protein
MKHANNAENALVQAKTYQLLINDNKVKVFIGCNISKQRKVSLACTIIDEHGSIDFKYQ